MQPCKEGTKQCHWRPTMIQDWPGGRVWSRDKSWTLGWQAESGLRGSGLQARPSSPCPQRPPCWAGRTHLSQSGVLGPTLSLRFPAPASALTHQGPGLSPTLESPRPTPALTWVPQSSPGNFPCSWSHPSSARMGVHEKDGCRGAVPPCHATHSGVDTNVPSGSNWPAGQFLEPLEQV